MKEQLEKRLTATQQEIEALNSDQVKLTKILKEIEVKLIFSKGKMAELSSLYQEIQQPTEEEAPQTEVQEQKGE